MGYTLINQNNYSNVKYANKKNPTATIKSSGCGICSMAMIMANLGGIPITVPALAAYSLKNGCRASEGTNMIELAQCICRDYPELTCTTTNDETVLRRHVEAGGMAIMNADGDQGVKGIFAAYGHFLAILGIRDGKPVIGDPAYTVNRYKTVYRKKYVTELGSNLITCDWSTLDLDTKYRSPNYYLFTYANPKTETKSTIFEEEDDMKIYPTINDVPTHYRQAVQTWIDCGFLSGEGKLSDGTLILNIPEVMCRMAAVDQRKNASYLTIEDVPTSYRPTIQKLIDEKLLVGEGKLANDVLKLNITEEYCRIATSFDRAGVFDK